MQSQLQFNNKFKMFLKFILFIGLINIINTSFTVKINGTALPIFRLNYIKHSLIKRVLCHCPCEWASYWRRTDTIQFKKGCIWDGTFDTYICQLVSC